MMKKCLLLICVLCLGCGWAQVTHIEEVFTYPEMTWRGFGTKTEIDLRPAHVYYYYCVDELETLLWRSSLVILSDIDTLAYEE